MLAGEDKYGTVILSFTGGGYMEEGPNLVEITSQKYSVHPSPSSPGCTIKHTLALEGGREIVTSQYRLPGPDGFAALLFGRTLPDLSAAKYIAPANREKLRIYKKDIGVRTLFCFAIATEPTFDAGTLKTPMKVTARTFSEFQIIALTGLLHVPRIEQSDWVHLCTSTPKFSPDETPLLIRDLPSNSVNQLAKDALASLEKLKAATFQRHLRFGASEWKLKTLLADFWKIPLDGL